MKNEKSRKTQNKHEAREDMETGDTARLGTQSGTPPEYETTATDFFSQLAPPGLQLLEPHDYQLVTTWSCQTTWSVLRIPFGGFCLVLWNIW